MSRAPLPVTALACLASVIATPVSARNDIRGITTTQPLADAMDTLELDGATCAPPDRGGAIVCTYDDLTRMTLYPVAAPPQRVAKLVYTFHFTDGAKMRWKLLELYGMRRDRIEGEHRLYTGERLDIELGPDGTGSLTITNDRLAQKDRAAEVR